MLRIAMAAYEPESTIQLLRPPPCRAALATFRFHAALLPPPAGPAPEIIVSCKLYDYIERNTQVLAVVPRGAAANVLRELDWGRHRSADR